MMYQILKVVSPKELIKQCLVARNLDKYNPKEKESISVLYLSRFSKIKEKFVSFKSIIERF